MCFSPSEKIHDDELFSLFTFFRFSLRTNSSSLKDDIQNQSDHVARDTLPRDPRRSTGRRSDGRGASR